jgi:hypothetical protein
MNKIGKALYMLSQMVLDNISLSLAATTIERSAAESALQMRETAFFLHCQEMTYDEIQELARRYYYLTDPGVVPTLRENLGTMLHNACPK